MGRVIEKVVVFLFYGLLAAVFMFTAMLTYDLLRTIMPGDNLTPIFGLALFDVGAIVWLLTFLKKAKGLGQRAVSLIAFAVDFIGSALMVIADLFLGGQTLAQVPDFIQGQTVVWVVGGVAALNLAMGYFFHILDPEEAKEIEMQTEVDNLAEEGLKEAKRLLREQKPELAALIAGDLFNLTLDKLGMHQTGSGFVLDGRSREVGQVSLSSSRLYQQSTVTPFEEPLITPEPVTDHPVTDLPTCSICHKPGEQYWVVKGKLVCSACYASSPNV
jgi:hypothetical protein